MELDKESNPFEIWINQESLDIRKIFYIEFDNKKRGVKIIHLADSSIIVWKTRYSSNSILKLLGRFTFIKIHRRYIVNKNHICGRGSKWEYLQICFFVGFIGLKGFLTERIDVGRSYLPQIKKSLKNFLWEIKDEEGDIYFINPIDIIYIELSKENKCVYLNKSFPVVKDKIEWRTRLSAIEIMKSTNIDGFIQVHRRFIINICSNYQFTADSEFKNLHPSSKRSRANFPQKIIPIGAKYKKIVNDIILKKTKR
jgi:DNA-binding LytR/AlgR family response regulator